MPSRDDLARYATIFLATLPAIAYGYRRPSPAWMLVMILGSVPILIYHVVVFAGRLKQRSPHQRRYQLLIAACVVVLPVASMVGDMANDLDFRFRRMTAYERVVERIERGEIAVGAEGVRIDVPPQNRGGALSISARRTAEAGLVVQFLWGTAGYAGGSAYLYCKGAACEQVAAWRHCTRINDRWLRATDH